MPIDPAEQIEGCYTYRTTGSCEHATVCSTCGGGLDDRCEFNCNACQAMFTRLFGTMIRSMERDAE